MFFTQEDYNKIYNWIKLHSIKDSDFPDARPLDGRETVTIVQQGHNVKFLLRDFLEQLFLLNTPDFINVTERYDLGHISLLEAIKAIPYRSRKAGQVITFLNGDGDWKIYQFRGERENQWNILTLWVDILQDIIDKGNILPDEEDLIAVKEGDKTVVKFKDKAYNPNNFSGKGRVYLRKNIVTVEDPETDNTHSINLLTQRMIGKENTIYIIQYDYNLNGQTITIPEGCTFNFQGGSISNGTINGLNTKIIAEKDYIFRNLNITGSFTSDIAYSQWVIDSSISNRNDTKQLGNLYKLGEIIELESTIFYISVPNANNGYLWEFEDLGDIYIHGNNATINVVSIKRGSNKWNTTILFHDNTSTIHNNIFSVDNLNFEISADTNIYTDKTKDTIDGDFYIFSVYYTKQYYNNITVQNFGEKNNLTGIVLYRYNEAEINNYTFNSPKECYRGGAIWCWNIYQNQKVSIRNSTMITNALDETISFNSSSRNGSSSISNSLLIDNCFIKNSLSFNSSGILRVISLDDNNYNVSNIVNIINSSFEYGNTLSPVSPIPFNAGGYTQGEEYNIINMDNCIIRDLGNYNLTLDSNYYNSGLFAWYASQTSMATINNSILDTPNFIIPPLNNPSRFGSAKLTLNNCDIKCKGLFCRPYNTPVTNIYFYTNNCEIKQELPITCTCNEYHVGTKFYTKYKNFFNPTFNTSSIQGNIVDKVIEGCSHNGEVLCPRMVTRGGVTTIVGLHLNLVRGESTYDSLCSILNSTLIKEDEISYGQFIVYNDNDDEITIRYYIGNISNMVTIKSKGYFNYTISSTDFSPLKEGENIIKVINNATKEILYSTKLYINRKYDDVGAGDYNNIPINPVSSQKYYATNINGDGSKNKLLTFCNGAWKDAFGLDAEIPFSGSLGNAPDRVYRGFSYFNTNNNCPIWWDGIKWVNCEGYNIKSIRTQGTFANKPIDIKIGYAYFCTDRQTLEGSTNGIMIYHKGNNIWVDALGRVIS